MQKSHNPVENDKTRRKILKTRWKIPISPWLLQGVGLIKREDYSEGYTIIVADLTPFEIGDNFDLKAEGTLSIDLAFKSPLAATINVLVYAEYDNVIEIDSNRNVIKDWSN